jgi:hypothetical protein
MPKQRPEFTQRDVYQNSFYDSKIQKVLISRKDSEKGWPLLVLEVVDSLSQATFNHVDGHQVFLWLYAEDKEFVSRLLEQVTAYHLLGDSGKSTERLIMEREGEWFEKNDEHFFVRYLERGRETRRLDWKEIPEQLIAQLENEGIPWADDQLKAGYIELSIEEGKYLIKRSVGNLKNVSKVLKENVKSLQKEWNAHIRASLRFAEFRNSDRFITVSSDIRPLLIQAWEKWSETD